METDIGVSIKITVEDRNGEIIPVDDISGNLRNMTVTLDVAMPTEEEYAILETVEPYGLTAKELGELLEEPSLDMVTVKEFVLKQDAAYKLQLVQLILAEPIPF